MKFLLFLVSKFNLLMMNVCVKADFKVGRRENEVADFVLVKGCSIFKQDMCLKAFVVENSYCDIRERFNEVCMMVIEGNCANYYTATIERKHFTKRENCGICHSNCFKMGVDIKGRYNIIDLYHCEYEPETTLMYFVNHYSLFEKSNKSDRMQCIQIINLNQYGNIKKTLENLVEENKKRCEVQQEDCVLIRLYGAIDTKIDLCAPALTTSGKPDKEKFFSRILDFLQCHVVDPDEILFAVCDSVYTFPV